MYHTTTIHAETLLLTAAPEIMVKCHTFKSTDSQPKGFATVTLRYEGQLDMAEQVIFLDGLAEAQELADKIAAAVVAEKMREEV